MIRGLIVICDEWTTRHSFYPIENCEIEKLKNWLESLKDRVLPQPKQEWSEEDEKILDGVITNYESGYLPSVEKRDEIIEKLTSLKERCTWKPSDEQMEAFYTYLYHPQYIDNSDDYRIKLVISLYEQLKKLRGE